MKILVSGPQGSGKTTQAMIIAGRYKLCYVSVGDILRSEYNHQSRVGKAAKEALLSGELADDSLVAKLVKKKLAEENCENSFVSDSYPRSVHQLEVFNPAFTKVFYLKVSDQEAINRLLKRHREDDTPELIQKRLSIYHQVTEPLLAYYKALDKLIEINGEQTIEKVSEEIELYLKEIENL